VRKEGRQIVDLKHLGSAHTKEKLTLLLEAAHQQLLGNQLSLFIPPHDSTSIVAVSSASLFLFAVLKEVYQTLQFGELDDETFAQLVLVRLIEPSSKLDTIRILGELGLQTPSYSGIHRCLKRVVSKQYRSRLAELCLAASSPQHLSLLLYDVTTLYFEIQKEDEFRKPGLSKERRLEPQIVVGLLVDRSGFPLSVQEFEGNLGETKTIVPVLTGFCTRHRIDTTQMTVTADAGMLSAKNLQKLEEAGFSFIVGSRIAKTPYEIKEWQKDNPEEILKDGQVFETTQTFGYYKQDKVERRVIYQYKDKRAKLDRLNIEKQVAKAKRIVEGKTPLKKAAFITITKQAKPTLNQALIDEHYLRAGIKGYVTNLPALEDDPKHGMPPQEVISAYHQLFQVEKSFRMSKSDLKARPIFHHQLDSIKAHLTIVFAALAIARHIEAKTQLSIKKFVQTLRTIRTPTLLINGIETQIAPLIPKEVQQIVDNLRNNSTGGH
jgi:transposase